MILQKRRPARPGGQPRRRTQLRPGLEALVARLICATRRPASWRSDYEPAKRAIDGAAESAEEYATAIAAYVAGVGL